MRLLPALLAGLTLLSPGIAPAQATALHTLLNDVFSNQLKRSPEFASAIGDIRYNDQLSDLSPRGFNDALAAEQEFLNRLLTIDTNSLDDADKAAAARLQRILTDDLEAASAKPWELPITAAHGIQTDLPALADSVPFASVQDYDNFIARLHLVPRQLRQASEDLLAGIDDHRVEPATVIEAALQQTDTLAAQAPADSAFAAPLKKFPAAITAAERKRIAAAVLDAIQTDVLPAYARFARFLRVTELPAAQQEHAPVDQAPTGMDAVKVHILALRDRAQTALGPKFELKSFHALILANWQLSPELLDQRIDAWIAASK